MPLQKLPVTGLDNENQRRRLPETLNQVLTHQFDDSRVRTKAEVLAGVTPVNYAYGSDESSGYVHVRRFGAVGDGTTDDTSAIQRAITVAQGSGKNLSVFFGSGNFAVSSSLTVANANQGISFIGQPWSSEQQGSQNPTCVIKWTGGASALFNCTTTFTSFFGISFQNFGTGTTAVASSNAGRIHMYRCSFLVPSGASNWSVAGLDFDSGGYSFFERCEIGCIPFMQLTGSVATTIEVHKSLFDSNSGSSTTPYFDFDVNLDNLYLHGNTFNFNSGARIVFSNASSSNSIGNIVWHCNEFDGNANAFQQYIGKFKNVRFIEFLANNIQQFGSSTSPLIELTNSRMYAAHNYGASIGAPLAKTTDTTSYIYSGPNNFTANTTEGTVDDGAQTGALIPVTIASAVARIHGELVSAVDDPTFSITSSATTAYEIQFAAPADGDAGKLETGQKFEILVRNASGGALAGVTFASSQFKTSGAFTAPANGYSRSIRFQYNGTVCVELSRSSADVAN